MTWSGVIGLLTAPTAAVVVWLTPLQLRGVWGRTGPEIITGAYWLLVAISVGVMLALSALSDVGEGSSAKVYGRRFVVAVLSSITLTFGSLSGLAIASRLARSLTS